MGREEEEVVRQLRQRLSILFTRDNVAMMGSRASTIPPAEVDGDIDNDFVQYYVVLCSTCDKILTNSYCHHIYLSNKPIYSNYL